MPDPLIDRFAAEHFTLNSISPQRRYQVRKALEKLSEWMEKPLEQTTDNELRTWLVYLIEEGRTPATANWYLRMVLPFYQWCWQQDLIPSETLMRFRAVKPPRGAHGFRPRPYSRLQVQRMWRELDEKFPYDTPVHVKNFRKGRTRRFQGPLRRHAMRLQLDAIIDLALVCGLRRNEIYELSVDDCHPDNHYVVVHGKRSDHRPKVREVPYPDSTREKVLAWLHFRAAIPTAPGTRLWLSVRGPLVTPVPGLSRVQMLRLMSSFGDWELHRLRHTCATERLRAGMPLEDLKEFLGHANIHMTLRYAKLVREDIHRSAARIDADFQAAIRPKKAA